MNNATPIQRLLVLAEVHNLDLTTGNNVGARETNVTAWYQLAAKRRSLFVLEQFVRRHAPRRNTPAFWRFSQTWKAILRRRLERERIATQANWRTAADYLAREAWEAGS